MKVHDKKKSSGLKEREREGKRKSCKVRQETNGVGRMLHQAEE